MKRFQPTPAFVVSLIALFVALGGTSYAAIASLPANSVGTRQLKNNAVTGAKVNPAVLRAYVHIGGTLPSGTTEVGDWGAGSYSGGTTYGYAGSTQDSVVTFPVPLASGLDGNHTIAVTQSSAPHCPGVGAADPGYLCVYEANRVNGAGISNYNIYNPEVPGPLKGTGTYGFGILLQAVSVHDRWLETGTYAVTAP